MHIPSKEVALPHTTNIYISHTCVPSRGLKSAANSMGTDLEKALLEASEGGKLPIVMDTSPCLSQLKGQVSEPALKFALYEPVEFIRSVGGDTYQYRCWLV